MRIFKKDIWEYKILEPYKINIEKTNKKYLSEYTGEDYERFIPRDFCEQFLETKEYRFYRYLSYSSGNAGYVLRQDKIKPKRIVFFGKNKRFNCLFKNFLFQVDEFGEIDRFYISARNIYTGEFLRFDWLSEKTYTIIVNGFARFRCQDSIKDVFVEDDKLIFKVIRKKSDLKEDNEKNNFDADTQYDLVINFEKGKFTATSIFLSQEFLDTEYILQQVSEIKNGRTGTLSKSDMVNFLVNITDAKRNLNLEQFMQVYSLFNIYQSDYERKTMSFLEYLECARDIINKFNSLAPYEKYSGAGEYETKQMMKSIDLGEASIKANGLVSAVRISIGDVFYNLDGSNAVVFSIVSISSALKNYLDKKSTNNPMFEKISKSFVYEIAKTCANNNEAINEMIKNISSLSQSFEDRIAIAKNNFEECNEIELYGIAAASLYCTFQKNAIDIEDESKLEMYFEIFKTVFVKLVESL